ncbi:MAG: NAD-dependent epimerase/dehydratase family protein [Chthoniobacterales bacterium]
MRVFVIGGTGFIGRSVVRNLAHTGHQVRVFHRGGTAAKLPTSVAEVFGERRDLRQFAPALQEWQPDAVLDTCAYDADDVRALKDAIGELPCNVTVLSSMDVYRAYGIYCRSEEGAPRTARLVESAPLRSRLFPYRARAQGPEELLYRYDKIPAEEVALHELHRPGTVLRLGKVYGPGDPQQHAQGYARMIANGVVRLSRERASWKWSRTYVENAAIAIAMAVTTPAEAARIYNVADEPAVEEQTWIGMVAEASGQTVEIEVSADAESDAAYNWKQHLVGDTSRLRNELGWSEKVEVREALKRTFATAGE